MVVHFKDKDPKKELSTKEILLEQPTGSREESYLEQISSYVKPGPLKGSIVKKVELFWPHKVLQVDWARLAAQYFVGRLIVPE